MVTLPYGYTALFSFIQTVLQYTQYIYAMMQLVQAAHIFMHDMVRDGE